MMNYKFQKLYDSNNNKINCNNKLSITMKNIKKMRIVKKIYLKKFLKKY